MSVSETSPEADPFDRRPPTTVESAEAAVLGASILSTEARTGALGMLDPDDFGREAHRVLFECLSEMHRRGDHVDHIAVNDRLATTNRLDTVGGLVAVFDLTDPLATPSPAAWRTYAAIAKREGRRRRGIRMLRRAIQRLEAGEDPGDVARMLGGAA